MTADQLPAVRPFDVAAWVEQLQEKHGAPGVKQQLAAVRMLFDWLITGQVLPSQAFDIEELAITSGEDVAFAVAIMRCGSGTEGGFLFRLTIGLRKMDGHWRIAHEHHSVPSAD